jgi:hypothetical protein
VRSIESQTLSLQDYTTIVAGRIELESVVTEIVNNTEFLLKLASAVVAGLHIAADTGRSLRVMI